MTDSRVFLRPFSLECIPRFLELAATYYPVGHEARNPSYLRWAFLESPAGPGRVAFAEAPSGRWSGMMGLVPFRVRLGDRVLVASMVVNVLVHPDHRKEKLFVKMIEKTRSELSGTDEWLMGHPNAAAVPGWRRTNQAFRDGYRVRVVPPLLGGLTTRGARVKDASSRLLDGDFSPLSAWQRDLGRPVLAADPDFLRWRFLGHPTRTHYRVFLDADASGVCGYRVDRPFKTSLARWVVDWQGEAFWRDGPARGTRPSFYAWPLSTPAPRTSALLPRLQKDYPFFATPCRTGENDGDPWSHVTLAATDFA